MEIITASQSNTVAQPVVDTVNGNHVLVGNATSRTMTFENPLQYGNDDITMFVVASKSNNTQDYLFGDSGASASAPSIISLGITGLIKFYGGSPRVTFKNSGSNGYQLLAVNQKLAIYIITEKPFHQVQIQRLQTKS